MEEHPDPFSRNAPQPAPPSEQSGDLFAAEDFITRLNDISGGGGPVTNAIIAANVAVFIVMGVLGAGWIETADIMPYIRYGANNGAATTDGEWWRLVTSMFMHYGLIHLLLNMWALFQAGHLVEKLLGRWSYTLMYFGSGIAGSLTTIVWNGDQKWSAGASGAVFGVYGALLGYIMREKHTVPPKIYQPLVKSTLTFAGYNLVYGLVHPRIDNAAHIGGLVGGLVLGWILALPVDRDVRVKLGPSRRRLALIVLGAVVAIGVTIAPRFNYRVSDELAWEETNREPIGKEAGILRKQEAVLNGYEAKKEPTALIAWLTDEGLPFYENWSRALVALELDPKKATASRRDQLLSNVQLRIESYQHLRDALQRNDARALEIFRQEQQVIIAAVRKFNEEK